MIVDFSEQLTIAQIFYALLIIAGSLFFYFFIKLPEPPKNSRSKNEKTAS